MALCPIINIAFLLCHLSIIKETQSNGVSPSGTVLNRMDPIVFSKLHTPSGRLQWEVLGHLHHTTPSPEGPWEKSHWVVSMGNARLQIEKSERFLVQWMQSNHLQSPCLGKQTSGARGHMLVAKRRPGF